MEEYSGVDEAWAIMSSKVLAMGAPMPSRDGPTLELTNVCMKIFDPERCVVSCPGRKFDPRYAAGEMLWYLSGSDSIDQIAHYAPSYKRFGVNGAAPGAYGPRVMPLLPHAIELLKRDRHSRQAIIPVWRPTDIESAASGGSPDIPCTVSLHFMVRNGQLNLTTYMRSNDLWLGFPYDTFCFITLMRIMADLLDTRPGAYCHLVGSLHMYQRDAEKARMALSVPWTSMVDSKPRALQASFRQLQGYVHTERTLRHGLAYEAAELISQLEQWPLVGDLVACAGRIRGQIKSTALAAAYDRRHPQC